MSLIVLSPDGNADNDLPQDAPPFKLCHGAEHLLEVKAPVGSTWVGQPLSLRWENTNGTPVRYGLSAQPQLVTNTHDIDDFYLDLPGSGADWKLSAAITVDVQSGDVALALGSYWQAPKYAIQTCVGDFRHELENIEWNGVTPIVEASAATVLAVTVVSVFDKTRGLPEKEVIWKLGDKKNWTVPTDKEGRSTLEYTPTADDLDGNEQATLGFTATCVDGFELQSCKEKDIQAYLTSPWPVQLKVLLDGEPITDFNGPSLRLARKLTHTLKLVPLKGDGDFIGKEITLRWPDDLEKLGITFQPATPQAMTAEGIEWTILGGDVSGLFTLEATTPTLGVPFSLPGAQLSVDLAEEAQLQVEVDVQGVAPIFQRGKEKLVRIVPKQGSPLGELGLAGTLKFVQFEGEIPASQVPATPAYGNESDPVTDSGFSWKLEASGSGNTGLFGLQVEMPGFTTPLTLEKALMMSSGLGNEARLHVNNQPWDGKPLLLSRNTPLILTLVPRADINSPLGKAGLKGVMTFVKGSLSQDNVPADPIYGKAETIVENGLGWTLTGQDVSGTFALNIEVEGFAAPWKIEEGMLLSSKLSDEALVTVDGAEHGRLVLRRGVPRTLKIVPRPESPLSLHAFDCRLSFTEGSLSRDKVVATPEYEFPFELTSAGLEWELKGGNYSGDCNLSVKVDGIGTPASFAFVALISSRLSDEMEVTLDGNAVAAGVVLHRNKARNIGFKPKTESPVGRIAFDCWMDFEDGSLGRDKVVAKPDYCAKDEMTQDGLIWEMRGADVSGTFTLNLHMDGFDDPWELRNSILVSSKLEDELSAYIGGPQVQQVGRVVFRRGVPQPLNLSPLPGSPLGAEVDITAWLMFIPVANVPENKVQAVPGYAEKKTGKTRDLEWSLTGVDVSGVFGVELHVEHFSSTIRFEREQLISTKLLDEVVVSPAYVKLSGSSESDITMTLRPGSPLSELEGQARLTVNEAGIGVRIGIVPSQSIPIPALPSSLSWKLKSQGLMGSFTLGIAVSNMTIDPLSVEGDTYPDSPV